MQTVTPKKLGSLLPHLLSVGLVPMIHGSPGIGKSDVIRDVADQLNLKVIDIRLSQCDPTDMNGFPSTHGEKASYKPLDMFPLESDTVPEGYDGWLIFFDEINHATRAVRKAAYKVLLDKMIGNNKLHPRVAMCAAGNLETDGALVEAIDTATQSRLIHLEMVVSTPDWLDWALPAGVDNRITSYIQMRPNSLMNFSSDHNDKTFACPRTWGFLNKLIKGQKDLRDLLPAIAGTVSDGVGNEFYQFTRIYDSLPTVSAILGAPASTPIPEDPSTLYALSGVVADNTEASNVDALLTFVDRMPLEFQIITIREMSRRCPPVTSNPKWASKAVELSQHM